MRAMRILGYRETQVLALAKRKIAEEGAPPSYGMICNELGIATRGQVSRIVKNLERRGEIARQGEGRARRIRLRANYQPTQLSLSFA